MSVCVTTSKENESSEKQIKVVFFLLTNKQQQAIGRERKRREALGSKRAGEKRSMGD